MQHERMSSQPARQECSCQPARTTAASSRHEYSILPAKLLPVFLVQWCLHRRWPSPRPSSRGNREFIFYIVVMLVLIAVMSLVHRRVKLTTRPAVGLFRVGTGPHGRWPLPPARRLALQWRSRRPLQLVDDSSNGSNTTRSSMPTASASPPGFAGTFCATPCASPDGGPVRPDFWHAHAVRGSRDGFWRTE
jgi:hypothetical protein